MKVKNISGENRFVDWNGARYDLPFDKVVDVPDDLASILIRQSYFLKVERKKKETKRG